MKYFDKAKKVQVPLSEITFIDGVAQLDGTDIVELPESNVFFNPLPAGKKIKFVNDFPDSLIGEREDLTPSELKDLSILDIKHARDKAMSEITVTHNSKEWTFNNLSMQRFESKIARNRPFNWKADDGSMVQLTKVVAGNIAEKIDDAQVQIFEDAESQIDALG